MATTKTKLCYDVLVSDGQTERHFDVAIGHADEFVALYQGETITFNSETMRFRKFTNPYQWYQRDQ